MTKVRITTLAAQTYRTAERLVALEKRVEELEVWREQADEDSKPQECEAPCDVCNGTGFISGHPCENCGEQHGGPEQACATPRRISLRCEECGGEGERTDKYGDYPDPCEACEGTGWVRAFTRVPPDTPEELADMPRDYDRGFADATLFQRTELAELKRERDEWCEKLRDLAYDIGQALGGVDPNEEDIVALVKVLKHERDLTRDAFVELKKERDDLRNAIRRIAGL